MSISVQGITKTFSAKGNKKEKKLVLKDISFEVHDGEFVSLVGPSGCGKTTTLTIIAGFQKPDSGQVLVNGKPVTKPGPDRAFVFQNYALLPWLKVGDNIMYPMKKQGVPKAERERRLKELLSIAQMEGSANSYIYELSGGMKQRVAILRGLACDPEILLMDEPLGAVDFQMRKLLQIQMEAMLQQRKVTTMMVTHDVDEAIYFSDRVVVMSRDHGRIMADVKIDLPRPRDRTSERYHEYMDQLTEVLKNALNGEVFNDEDKDLMKFIENVETGADLTEGRSILGTEKETSAPKKERRNFLRKTRQCHDLDDKL
ncbi:ABC transporter ATP-binding protein [Flavonifractor sp. An135]|nr:ABC transporter ATP-binding protein [Flavonifractor sp. An135]